MTKSSITNLIALTITLFGFFIPFSENKIIFTVGLFSLSGSLTNWLAIHMLFEKIPFLYGSGVVPNNFSKFKNEIRNLMINQFFTIDKIEKFLSNLEKVVSNSLKKNIDFNIIFNDLMNAIEESKIGGMLKIIGGKTALEPLREPVKKKLRFVIENVLQKQNEKTHDQEFLNTLMKEIISIIDERLNQLSPDDIKVIVKEMIEIHLGWLVIWGGVIGGIIGFIFGLLYIT